MDASRGLPSPSLKRSGRPRRVVVLLTAIVLLSLADLAITLAYLRGTGMMEANPVAALVIRWTQSSFSLTCFKLLTMTICVALLYRLRARAITEAAAWTGLAAMIFMSLQWHQYTNHLDVLETTILADGGSAGDDWLYVE